MEFNDDFENLEEYVNDYMGFFEKLIEQRLKGLSHLEKLFNEYTKLFSRLLRDLSRITEFYKDDINEDVSLNESKEYFNFFANYYIKSFSKLFEIVNSKINNRKYFVNFSTSLNIKNELESAGQAIVDHIRSSKLINKNDPLYQNIKRTLNTDSSELMRYECAYRDGKIIYLKHKFTKDLDTLKNCTFNITESYIKRFYRNFLKIGFHELNEIFNGLEFFPNSEFQFKKLRKSLPDHLIDYDKFKPPVLDSEKSTNFSDQFIEHQNLKYLKCKKNVDIINYTTKDTFQSMVSKTIQRGVQTIILESEITSTTKIMKLLASDFSNLEKNDIIKKFEPFKNIDYETIHFFDDVNSIKEIKIEKKNQIRRAKTLPNSECSFQPYDLISTDDDDRNGKNLNEKKRGILNTSMKKQYSIENQLTMLLTGTEIPSNYSDYEKIEPEYVTINPPEDDDTSPYDKKTYHMNPSESKSSLTYINNDLPNAPDSLKKETDSKSLDDIYYE